MLVELKMERLRPEQSPRWVARPVGSDTVLGVWTMHRDAVREISDRGWQIAEDCA